MAACEYNPERYGPPVDSDSVQLETKGNSAPAIHAAALAHALPAPGLRWADIGCGSGDLLRLIHGQWEPAELTGADLLPWLDPELAPDVTFVRGDALAVLRAMEPVDRLLMVEVIEHLEAPWTALREAASKVAPSGSLVVTTPNVRTLRHRLELGLRGELTSFRPGNAAHLTPVLEHVLSRILAEEGLTCQFFYAQADVVPFTGGRLWPAPIADRFPRLTKISVGVTASRPSGPQVCITV